MRTLGKTAEEIDIAEEVEDFLRNQRDAKRSEMPSTKQVRGSSVEVISKKGGEVIKRTITL